MAAYLNKTPFSLTPRACAKQIPPTETPLFCSHSFEIDLSTQEKLKLAEAGSKFFLLKNSPFHRSKNKALMGADIKLAVLPYRPLRHLTAELSQIQH